MAVTIASGQRQSPNSFQNVETFTAMTTTTATSEAHGQTIDPDTEISVLAGATETRLANVYQLANGIEGQEKWITLASATGASMVALTLGPSEQSATAGFTATTAIVVNDADDIIGLKYIAAAWRVIYNVGATAATASSPFA